MLGLSALKSELINGYKKSVTAVTLFCLCKRSIKFGGKSFFVYAMLETEDHESEIFLDLKNCRILSTRDFFFIEPSSAPSAGCIFL